jgi:hypothetical protein
MAYFNYHSKIKTQILNGKLTKYYFDQNYNKIGFALVLCFGDKKYPIREHKFEEYFALIGECYTTTQNGKMFFTTFNKK